MKLVNNTGTSLNFNSVSGQLLQFSKTKTHTFSKICSTKGISLLNACVCFANCVLFKFTGYGIFHSRLQLLINS